MRRFRAAVAAVGLVAAVTACGQAVTAGGGSQEKPGAGPFKIALNLSYTGNDWQNEAANLIKAEAKTAPYDREVDLRVDISGPDVTKQIQMINNEVASGVAAIIMYPISPTALNATVQKACQAGVIVAAYDGMLTAPCAYNFHDDQYDLGLQNATWLAKALHGKGQIARIDGVAGTSVNADRIHALNDVLAKNPGISVVATGVGDWAQAQTRTAFASIYASHPNISGVFSQVGCNTIASYLASIQKPLIPCVGELENQSVNMMLPKSLGGEGLIASGAGSPPWDGELAFLEVVRILKGQVSGKMHDTILPLPFTTSDQVAELGAKAIGTNPVSGALAFPESSVPPGFFADIWSPLAEQGLKAALNGTPDKISTAKLCSEVPGCKQTPGLTFDAKHPSGN